MTFNLYQVDSKRRSTLWSFTPRKYENLLLNWSMPFPNVWTKGANKAINSCQPGVRKLTKGFSEDLRKTLKDKDSGWRNRWDQEVGVCSLGKGSSLCKWRPCKSSPVCSRTTRNLKMLRYWIWGWAMEGSIWRHGVMIKEASTSCQAM